MRRIFIFLFTLSLIGCASLKKEHDTFIVRGYYFVIQLQSIKSDTIFFKTIEIYSPSPTLTISNLNSDTSSVDIVRFPLNNFKKGYLKGVKRKSIGNVLLLYTKRDWITDEKFVKFDYIDCLKSTDLSKMYRLGECQVSQ